MGRMCDGVEPYLSLQVKSEQIMWLAARRILRSPPPPLLSTYGYCRIDPLFPT